MALMTPIHLRSTPWCPRASSSPPRTAPRAGAASSPSPSRLASTKVNQTPNLFVFLKTFSIDFDVVLMFWCLQETSIPLQSLQTSRARHGSHWGGTSTSTPSRPRWWWTASGRLQPAALCNATRPTSRASAVVGVFLQLGPPRPREIWRRSLFSLLLKTPHARDSMPATCVILCWSI